MIKIHRHGTVKTTAVRDAGTRDGNWETEFTTRKDKRVTSGRAHNSKEEAEAHLEQLKTAKGMGNGKQYTYAHVKDPKGNVGKKWERNSKGQFDADPTAEGLTAFKAGKALTDNPYDSKTETSKASAWRAGWRQGQSKGRDAEPDAALLKKQLEEVEAAIAKAGDMVPVGLTARKKMLELSLKRLSNQDALKRFVGDGKTVKIGRMKLYRNKKSGNVRPVSGAPPWEMGSFISEGADKSGWETINGYTLIGGPVMGSNWYESEQEARSAAANARLTVVDAPHKAAQYYEQWQEAELQLKRMKGGTLEAKELQQKIRTLKQLYGLASKAGDAATVVETYRGVPITSFATETGSPAEREFGKTAYQAKGTYGVYKSVAEARKAVESFIKGGMLPARDTVRSEAYQRGVRDARRKVKDCPYPTGSHTAKDWLAAAKDTQ